MEETESSETQNEACKPLVKHVVLIKHKRTIRNQVTDAVNSPLLENSDASKTADPNLGSMSEKHDSSKSVVSGSKSTDADLGSNDSLARHADKKPDIATSNALSNSARASPIPRIESLRGDNISSDEPGQISNSDRSRVPLRSSFMDTINAKKLLKSEVGQAVYSMPQPQCYGDDTLKAVKLITEKYDSVKRRQMRAVSFRPDATLSRCPEADHDPADQSRSDSRTDVKPPRDHFNNLVGDSRTNGCAGDELAQRLELFHRCYESETYACSCLAKLFLTSPKAEDELVHEGVPLWLLETGLGSRIRELMFIMCDADTLLQVWSDRINYLSKYEDSGGEQSERAEHAAEHTFHSSRSLARVYRVVFDDRHAAAEFLDHYRAITADPNDALWTVSDNSRLQASLALRKVKNKNRSKLKKSLLSAPCNFVHLVHVDAENYSSLGCVHVHSRN